ncbi:TPA: hypothetical protein R6W23_003238 [Citrobacter gillenii]|nr:hypothetical protein [Citrobacter gillenii]
MTALNKHSELRKELSNPSIGSKDHLRKLALSLLDEMERANTETDKANSLIHEIRAERNFLQKLAGKRQIELEAAEKRIAELEARTVMLPTPYPKGYGLAADKYNFALEECADAIRAAGIGVKGE